MKSATREEHTMKAILTSGSVKLIAVASVAVLLAALLGNGQYH
jgi:hypothetical protein